MSVHHLRSTAVGASLVVAFAGLVGCTGNSSAGDSVEDPHEITIAIPEKLSNLDPTKNFTSPLLGIENLYGGTLTMAVGLGDKAVPGLAESWTSGEKSWTFTLRQDLKFSDGSPLTAEDVAASLNFYAEQESSALGYIITLVSSVRVVDERTVEVELSGPSPRLDLAMSQPGTIIFPADEIAEAKTDPAEFADGGTSAGQYMLESASPTKAVLKVNPHYWGPTPAVDQLTFVSVPDPASRLAQLQSGQIDYAQNLPEQAAEQLTGDVHGTFSPSNGTEFLVINNRPSAPTASVKLREAINAAIDREQLNEVVFFGENYPSLSFFPEGTPYYREYLSPTADVEKAKDLLAESGCASPCSLTIKAQSITGYEGQIAQLIAQQLTAAGIDASVNQEDSGAFYDSLAKGNFDLAVTATYGFYLEDYLNYTMPSGGGGPAAYAGWTGADAYENKWKTASGEEFKTVIDEVLDQYETELPFVPLVGYGFLQGSRVSDDALSLSPQLYYQVATQ